jgi:predicted nucleotidyltransferase
MQKTALLDEYRKGKKQKAEILRNEMVKRIHDALFELSKKIHFKNAYIFGSILKPYFSDESDIDVAFEGLKNEDFFKAMAFLSDHLGRDVDVIQLEGHRLRDKIIKEGVLVKSDEICQL